ncbi:TetR/AcrR family transcriptional regulator [Alteribacter aurantiacus]|uniref:TetR/AcrR family transcriptional regulator n=1 Tax=Alteribacter aurantiacus TaxID=254410 RepID=UPI000412DE5E|nr:TetR/AcrR family transcriptional regulator [Alteribacter aurantiacus]
MSAKGETQKRIIETAHVLFMEHGYRAVSTRRIADICGLTQPALYHHFPNKEAIYLEVLRTDLRRTREAITRLAKEYEDVRECLFQVTYYILGHSPENMGQMVKDIRSEMSEEFREKIHQWWNEAYCLPLVEIFERGIQSGVIRDPEQFDASAEKYVCVLVNMISQSVPSRQEVSEEGSELLARKRASFILEVLLNGLTKEGAGKG